MHKNRLDVFRVKRRKKYFPRIWLILLLIVIIAIFFKSPPITEEAEVNPSEKTETQSKVADVTDIIQTFARQNNLQSDEWPGDLIEAFRKNPEMESYVLNYPLKKEKDFEIDISNSGYKEDVPLFMQWDERWGYNQYAGELMGLSGCGPTCLSMVCTYLLQDDTYNPEYVAEFAENNGYSSPGNGSAWTLISDGGEELGLDVTEIPLNEDRIISNLEVGNPIICIMGAGDFTSTGHFIVLTEYTDGKVRVNDPYSKSRSEKLWELSDIMEQVDNLWVCRRQ